MIDSTYVDRLPGLMPYARPISLLKRIRGNEFAEGVMWQTARQKAKIRATESIGNVLGGPEHCQFTLVKIDETIEPQQDDRIVDADGVTWSVMSVFVKFFDRVYECTCERLVADRDRTR